jgi:hypothetical protein
MTLFFRVEDADRLAHLTARHREATLELFDPQNAAGQERAANDQFAQLVRHALMQVS